MNNSELTLSDCGAIVLIGGYNRRMGVAKATLRIEHQTFLDRIVQTLRRLALPVWLVTGVNSSAIDYPACVTVVRDEYADRGPIEGLRCGLKVAKNTVEWLFVTSCDAPLLHPAFVRLILERRAAHLDAVVPHSGTHYYPLNAAFRTTALGPIEQQIAAGNFSLHALLQGVRCCQVTLETIEQVDVQLDSLRNVNSPQDYQRLLEDLADRQRK
ncbi:MAG: molybdenum cofactor guanylyltransferase [Planctomycetales bacterium]|nr:molybdenum cofactor guanylyltransferase [Planctomycetales bacterium]